MTLRERFCKGVFCAMLGMAALGGAPMRPEQVEELMAAMNQPKIARSLPTDEETGDGLIKKLKKLVRRGD